MIPARSKIHKCVMWMKLLFISKFQWPAFIGPLTQWATGLHVMGPTVHTGPYNYSRKQIHVFDHSINRTSRPEFKQKVFSGWNTPTNFILFLIKYITFKIQTLISTLFSSNKMQQVKKCQIKKKYRNINVNRQKDCYSGSTEEMEK